MQVGLGMGVGADSKSNLLFCRNVAERKQRKVLFANFNFFILSQGSLKMLRACHTHSICVTVLVFFFLNKGRVIYYQLGGGGAVIFRGGRKFFW